MASSEVNPYQTPEAPIVEPAVARPRPLRVFVAGAVCCGAAVLPLTLATSLGFILVSRWTREGLSRFPPRVIEVQFLIVVFSTYCGFSFLVAGVSFLRRHGGTGRAFLASAILGIVAGFALSYLRY